MKIMDELILLFSRVSFQNSLWRLSTFREYMGIYSRVCMECKESVATKQGVLAAQARD